MSKQVEEECLHRSSKTRHQMTINKSVSVWKWAIVRPRRVIIGRYKANLHLNTCNHGVIISGWRNENRSIPETWKISCVDIVRKSLHVPLHTLSLWRVNLFRQTKTNSLATPQRCITICCGSMMINTSRALLRTYPESSAASRGKSTGAKMIYSAVDKHSASKKRRGYLVDREHRTVNLRCILHHAFAAPADRYGNFLRRRRPGSGEVLNPGDLRRPPTPLSNGGPAWIFQETRRRSVTWGPAVIHKMRRSPKRYSPPADKLHRVRNYVRILDVADLSPWRLLNLQDSETWSVPFSP